MSKILAALKRAASQVVALARANPVRVSGIVVAVVLFGASRLGLVIDKEALLKDVAIVVPVLLGSEFGHAKTKSPKA